VTPQKPTLDRLLEIVEAMPGRPVVMLVDLVADRYLHGSPKRISREAPVLILRYESEELLPGGGANAVANVAALGGRPLVLGVVGTDAAGDRLLEVLAGLGVDPSGVYRRAGYQTPTKTRILAGGRHAIKQQVVRFDVEDVVEPGPEEQAFFAAQLGRWGGSARVAVLSDYGYGAVDPSLVGDCRRAVGKEGLLVCDSRYRLGSYTGLDGATPNEEEAEALLGRPLGEGETLREGGRALCQSLGARFVLVTRGSFGMSLFTTEESIHLPIHGTDQVADVTGAGDTVIGTFALALAAGASPLEAALLANYAGGVVVMKRGTATLACAELAAAVAADPRPREELVWARW
jgi:rfaE bifunctional protein kinase chain/domain